MLTVITEGHYGTQLEEDRSRGVVVIESDQGLQGGNFAAAWHELESQEARHRALGFAASNGVGDARINGSPTAPYPVNGEGVPLDFVRDEHGQPLPLVHPRMQVKRYRVNVPVTRRLV